MEGQYKMHNDEQEVASLGGHDWPEGLKIGALKNDNNKWRPQVGQIGARWAK